MTDDDMYATPPPNGPIFVATKTAFLELDGINLKILKDVTRVRDGHPLLQALPNMFRLITPTQFRCHACPARSELPWCEEHAPAPRRRRRLRRPGAAT